MEAEIFKIEPEIFRIKNLEGSIIRLDAPISLTLDFAPGENYTMKAIARSKSSWALFEAKDVLKNPFDECFFWNKKEYKARAYSSRPWIKDVYKNYVSDEAPEGGFPLYYGDDEDGGGFRGQWIRTATYRTPAQETFEAMVSVGLVDEETYHRLLPSLIESKEAWEQAAVGRQQREQDFYDSIRRYRPAVFDIG